MLKKTIMSACFQNGDIIAFISKKIFSHEEKIYGLVITDEKNELYVIFLKKNNITLDTLENFENLAKSVNTFIYYICSLDENQINNAIKVIGTVYCPVSNNINEEFYQFLTRKSNTLSRVFITSGLIGLGTIMSSPILIGSGIAASVYYYLKN